jgi:hypothetical protein
MDLIASPPRLSLAAPPTEVRRPSRPSRAVLLTALLIDGNAPALFLFAFGDAGALHGALLIHRWLFL